MLGKSQQTFVLLKTIDDVNVELKATIVNDEGPTSAYDEYYVVITYSPDLHKAVELSGLQFNVIRKILRAKALDLAAQLTGLAQTELEMDKHHNTYFGAWIRPKERKRRLNF